MSEFNSRDSSLRKAAARFVLVLALTVTDVDRFQGLRVVAIASSVLHEEAKGVDICLRLPSGGVVIGVVWEEDLRHSSIQPLDA